MMVRVIFGCSLRAVFGCCGLALSPRVPWSKASRLGPTQNAPEGAGVRCGVVLVSVLCLRAVLGGVVGLLGRDPEGTGVGVVRSVVRVRVTFVCWVFSC